MPVLSRSVGGAAGCDRWGWPCEKSVLVLFTRRLHKRDQLQGENEISLEEFTLRLSLTRQPTFSLLPPQFLHEGTPDLSKPNQASRPPPAVVSRTWRDELTEIYSSGVGDVYSIDVECVASGRGHRDRVVGRIAMVDSDCNLVYDRIVNPKLDGVTVVSYLERLTGLKKEICDEGVDLKTAVEGLKEVRIVEDDDRSLASTDASCPVIIGLTNPVLSLHRRSSPRTPSSSGRGSTTTSSGYL